MDPREEAMRFERLSLRGLARTRLASSFYDANWGLLRAMLRYMAAWYGRDRVAIERFFPSTRACSGCGGVFPKRALFVRTCTFDARGVTHDRDANAAHNILAAALAVRAGPIPADVLSRGRQTCRAWPSVHPH